MVLVSLFTYSIDDVEYIWFPHGIYRPRAFERSYLMLFKACLFKSMSLSPMLGPQLTLYM